jgi:hypothetical protein
MNKAVNGVYPTVKKALPLIIEEGSTVASVVNVAGKGYAGINEIVANHNYINGAADLIEGAGTVALLLVCPEAVVFWGIGCYINDTFIR